MIRNGTDKGLFRCRAKVGDEDVIISREPLSQEKCSQAQWRRVPRDLSEFVDIHGQYDKSKIRYSGIQRRHDTDSYNHGSIENISQ